MVFSFDIRGSRLWLALLIGLLLVSVAGAQTQFGTITGRVIDKSGALVVDATVTLMDTANQTSKIVKTGADGVYSFAAVTPSTYRLDVSKQGFATIQKGLIVNPADRLTQDFTLEVGSEKTTVTVEANMVMVNTTSGDVSHVITTQDLQNIPLLTKNPYALIGLAAGAADTGGAVGDTRSGGFAVNGLRTSSLNFLLDGTENNETFVTGPAALVPNDAVQEFKVQGSNMTSEFGRNAAVTNVVTKSGTNAFHGSASEYWRGAAITANTVQNKQNDTPRPAFVRNDFTFTGGGPIIKDKTFFFAAAEGVRVRSAGNNFWWVPTQDFVSLTSPQMAAYLNAGGLPSSNPNNCITTGEFAANNPNSEGGVPTLVDQLGNPIPLSTPLFCQVVTSVPIDAGGGAGQNTWNALGKVDHRFTSNTQLSFRFAFTNQDFPVGAGADSPYEAFRAPYVFTSSNYAATLSHAFSSSMVNETRLAFSRTEPNSPNGTASPLIPCIQFGNRNMDNVPIVFPGYLPTICNYSSLRSGGPQNTISAGTGFTKVHNKHTFKWGAYFSHLRDNHTFGAYENANGVISDPQHLIDGLVDTRYSVAIDPKGKVPGDYYDPAIDGPFVAPNFTRHYRYNEVGLYGEDSIRLTSRFTLTLGMRWEYFGVLHSPEAERTLDANFLLDAIGQSRAMNPSKTIYEQIRDGRFQRVNNLFNQDWNNFGPRIGFAYDLFGNGSTSIRGGYGIFYDKNFGNALFNAIQNPPNYNVAALSGFDPVSIDANEYVLLTNVVGTGAAKMGGSARMLNRDMKTAYSQQWNVGFEHDIMRKGLIASVQYVGTKGDQLYSLNNLNQLGSCILAPAGALATCDPSGESGSQFTRLNQTGVTGLNRRGNEGFSRYHSVRTALKTRPFGGLTLDTYYTYANWKDNSSSFFADASFDANWGFGFRDPFNPKLDYAPSTNDIRHRFVMAYNWDVPFAKNMAGVGKHVLDGWTISGVFSAQTGGAFSVYDANNGDNWCSLSGTNFCYPMAGTTPTARVQYAGGNAFHYYDLSGYQSQADYCAQDMTCTAYLELTQPQLLEKRNSLRLPGIWNFDAAVAKKFKVGEKVAMNFHVEALNVFNHSNFYGNALTNDISAGFFDVTRGVLPGAAVGASGVAVERRALQLGVKVTF